MCIPNVYTQCVYPICVPNVCILCVHPMCISNMCIQCMYPICVPDVFILYFLCIHLGLTQWIWINSGGCNVDAMFLKNPPKRSVRLPWESREPWRIKTLEFLKQRNESEINRYKTFNRVIESEVRSFRR